MDIKSEIASLILKIKHYDKLYHGDDVSQISDFEYDMIKKQLSDLFEKYPNDFPNGKMPEFVGYKPKSKFEKVTHKYPMLSLDNAFDLDDMQNFFKRILKHTNNCTLIAEPKIDGLSCSAVYQNGEYKMGVTRGDGTIGENVSMQIATINDIPKQISYKNDIEIRGEIYIEKQEFIKINQNQKKNDKKEFKTARNTAAGTVRQLDIGIVKNRNLKFFAYEIKPNIYKTEHEKFELLKNMGFKIFDDYKICKNIDECNAFYKMIAEKRNALPYEIDGIVYKLNSIPDQQKIGKSNRAPKYSIAYKFKEKEAEAKIINIEFQIGKTGILTPVAKITPTEIDGVILSNISIHNISELSKKDIKINDTVIIKRAGDVIPYITSVVIEKRDQNTKNPDIPKNCISCNMPLTIANDTFLVCENNINCREQIKQQIIFMVSKECFNIEGLGKSTIDLFLNKNIINDAADIFQLDTKKDLILSQNGWSDLSYNNLILEIDIKKNVTLARFLNALGIKNMGRTMSKTIAAYFKTFINFKNGLSDKENLKKIDGISDKTATDIIKSFNQNKKKAEKILQHIKITDEIKNQKIDENHMFYNKNIAITGSFDNKSREEITKIIENFGGIVKGGVSKKTDFVIAGRSPGSKLKKATDLKINIIDHDKIINIINK